MISDLFNGIWDPPALSNRNNGYYLLCSVGAVMESKAQLVGIHERVRSDIEGRQPPSSTVSSTTQGGARVVSAANPNAEDAAELLRYVVLPAILCVYTNAHTYVTCACIKICVSPARVFVLCKVCVHVFSVLTSSTC